MNKIKEYFAGIDTEILSTRRVVFLEVLAAFLFGVTLGILISPPKTIKMGCNNGNNNIAKGNGFRKKEKEDKNA